MVDINFIEHLIDSMGEAVSKLDTSVFQKNFNEANELRIFIFDLHKKIEMEILGKDV